MFKMDFFEVIEQALAEQKGIEVSVHIPGLFSPEIIYNAAENVPQKAMYYSDNYDDSMRHLHDKTVRIISARVK